MGSGKKVLILSANPKNMPPRSVDKEMRGIQEGLERTNHKSCFSIKTQPAARTSDLRRSLLDEKPEIVHFCGTGIENKGIILENENGNSQVVSPNALSDLFALFSNCVKCVVLSACYTEQQAESISQHIDYVIGVNEKIGDQAAQIFAVAFYDALLAGETNSSNQPDPIEFAYKLGCNAIDMEGLSEESLAIILKKKKRADNISAKKLEGANHTEFNKNTPHKHQFNEVTKSENKDKLNHLDISSKPWREPSGQIPLGSDFYIDVFSINDDCYQEIFHPGGLIQIKASRLMGKTSLMARMLRYSSEKGYTALHVNLQSLDRHELRNLDTFLRAFSEQIGRKMDLLERLDDFWVGHSGSKGKCTTYFEECVLKSLDTPLVLGIDNVETIFSYRDIADDFLSLLRSWYESARYGDSTSPLWEKLRLVVVQSTEVYIPSDINQSAFNGVGTTIKLPDFTKEQVFDLIEKYHLKFSANDIEDIMFFLGGHPYLTHKAIYHIARQDLTLDELLHVNELSENQKIYSSHLQEQLNRILQNKELVNAFREVVASENPIQLDLDIANTLNAFGLINLNGNKATPRCSFYQQYFSAQFNK